MFQNTKTGFFSLQSEARNIPLLTLDGKQHKCLLSSVPTASRSTKALQFRSWGCVHVSSVRLVPSLPMWYSSLSSGILKYSAFVLLVSAFRTRLPVCFCFISASCGLSCSFMFQYVPLFPPWNTDDQQLFVLNHPSDHNLYATGIKGIFKSFHVHFCGPQIYIPMKIP